MDVLHKALKWVDHNRFKALGIVLALVLVCYAGCAVKTASLKDPTVKVTAPVYAQEAAELRAQLEAEGLALQAQVDAHNKKTEAFNAREEIGYEDLKAKQAKKEAMVAMVSTAVIETAQTAGVPIPESASKLILGIVSAVGAGGTVLGFLDGRRKDRVIRNQTAAAPPDTRSRADIRT